MSWAQTTCDECRFWQQHGRSEYGDCRRRTPAVYTSPKCDDDTRHACWPITFCEHWCGEAQPVTAP